MALPSLQQRHRRAARLAIAVEIGIALSHEREGAQITCCVAIPGRLCTDSRDQDEIKRDAPKHFRPAGCDYLVATAGDCAALMAAEHCYPWPKRPTLKSLTRWLHANHDPERSNFAATSMLVVTRSRLFVMYGQYVYERADAAAIGSGAPYALGYLRAAPADLEGAVAAACFYDPACAGPVQKAEV